MNRSYSVRLTFSRMGSSLEPYSVYTTPRPFEASREEALQAEKDIRDKLMSICSMNNDLSCTPLVAYERNEENGLPSNSCSSDFYSVVFETIIPSSIIRSSMIRIELITKRT